MKRQITVEVCVDSVASAVAAERGGAQRIELCSALLEGGVTPSLGLLSVIRSKVSIGLHAIIRPRPGDFSYSEAEFEIMRRDLELAKTEGADGVVLGLMKSNGRVDVERTRELVQQARPLSVTFHRAFDLSVNLDEALEDVCATGADRLLTSGGEQECSQGVDTIARLVQAADDRITIMAGGRIRSNNVLQIVERAGVSEIHVGLATPTRRADFYQHSRVSLGRAEDRAFEWTQVREESVRDLIRALSQAAEAGGD